MGEDGRGARPAGAPPDEGRSGTDEERENPMARRRTAQPPAAQRRSTADQLRWALAADVCALVRRSPGITRARVAQELGISSGTAADLVTRMRQAAGWSV